METTAKMIEELRSYLENAAKQTGFNFLDPNILKISQQLDKLIVAQMMNLSKRL